ncbi:polysaccharide biosynthesis protein GtrA [Marinitenerispora sediminis]|uniref:Polysaccharide biosynthesis protein GtrA n=2 Tax=Marinitenerispora sediminis TaxID=1931232 RepID=A0A368TBH8_9ACTN|nr:GtrA family protein [Marinitenerispora sediminis]RCV54303.1 polysaccharide biosynthesis protein GtrA [Marinitenerispora sediminis]RCV60524.1 polysaccharide biosynthesis protein GtrA [Marinitenerispora sediminis]RCV61076.1 polysaccharide biosynthesis protein GtrA [Marinitenerispora sediminis]
MLRALYQRFSHLLREVAKFGTVGAVAYVVQLATTNLFWSVLGTPLLAGQALGTVCATVVAFLGNRYWTFGHRARTGLAREYVLFFLMNGVGLLIQVGCLWFSDAVLGLDGPLARNIAGNVVGVGLGSLFRFWSYRTWVFPARDAAEPGTAPAAEAPASRA